MKFFSIFLILKILLISNASFAQEISKTEIQNVNYASVLMYHRFGENKYPTIQDGLNAIQNISLVKDRSVIITIDDAYSSVFNNAWPILKKYGLPFTLFVSTDVIDNKTPGYMSWEEIRILRDNGVTIGSQTKSHPHMHNLSENQIVKELEFSNTRFVQEIGSKPEIFAYPYGEYNLNVVKKIKINGFKAAFGQHSGVAHLSLGLYQLPRFAMNENYGNMQRFLLAVNAKPLPISDLSPKDPVIIKNPPFYGFTLSNTIKPKGIVRCFASNGIKSETKRLGKNRIEVRLEKPFPKGRGRINCTMSAGERWRWLGRQFIIK